MEAFGMFGFIMALLAYSKVKRLERILRENHIRPTGAVSLGGSLREKVGSTVFLTIYEGEGDTTTSCKILDVDEEWAHVLRNEGKKNQRELLIRLEDIKQVRE